MSNIDLNDRIEFEDHMVRLQKQVLDENRALLCDTIQPARHFPYLRQQQVLTLEGQQLIEHEVTNKAKVNKLIDELQMNGGPKAFMTFVEALVRDGTQSHVVRKLNMDLEKKTNRPIVEKAVKEAPASSRKVPIQIDDVDQSSFPLPDIESEPVNGHPLPGPPLPSIQNLRGLKPSSGSSMPKESECNEDKLVAHGQSEDDKK